MYGQEENNHGFDPRAIATSLIATSNLGETQALEVNLAKHDQNNKNMHVAFEILDIVYLILMHVGIVIFLYVLYKVCLLYTSPSPRDATLSRMPSSA